MAKIVYSQWQPTINLLMINEDFVVLGGGRSIFKAGGGK
jgi:hypothetical protein